MKIGFRTLIAAGSLLSASSVAHAVQLLPLEYRALDTSGGLLNPGVILAFNPQPDPPGIPILDLADPFEPKFTQPPGTGAVFDFVLSFVGLPGLLLPAVQKPDSDGVTTFTFNWDDHMFDVGLTFSGPGGVKDWASFNPQPDPPGIWFADVVTFAGAGDPAVALTISENGTNLSFSTPEPTTWAMMGLGFAALGFMSLRRTHLSSAAAKAI
jgi:PEP-CTERM motif